MIRYTSAIHHTAAWVLGVYRQYWIFAGMKYNSRLEDMSHVSCQAFSRPVKDTTAIRIRANEK
jgi:hypothetical protein